MCSVNWRQWLIKGEPRIGLVFNRDESVIRPEALPPQRFSKQGVEFLMPVDPVGRGSWIALNNQGWIFFLLNDYQGQLKPITDDLHSRGDLIRQLATCRSFKAIKTVIKQWPIDRSQPFFLGCLSFKEQAFWHYDGNSQTIVQRDLPNQWYSSGHPKVDQIISARKSVVKKIPVNSLDALIELHRSHQPDVDGDKTFSFCMHREEARTQSMTVIELSRNEAKMSYWPGQPCEINPAQVITKHLVLTAP